MSMPGQSSYRHAYFICGIAALGGFLFSFDGSAFGGTQLLVRAAYRLDALFFGLALSAGIFGSMLAPIPGAWLCDRWGSRRMMRVAALFLLLGAIGVALSAGPWGLVGARVVSGLGAGLASLACPMYISEVAPPARRGALGLLMQIAIMVGSLGGIVLAWGGITLLPADTAWRWVVAAVTVPCLAFATLTLFLPASPRWLARRGRDEEARAVLARLDGPEEADRVLQGIRASLAHAQGSFRGLLQPRHRAALATGLLLALFNNWTGWSLIGTYLPTLMQKIGYPRANVAVGMTIIPTAIGLGFTFLTSLIIDRVGRRPLWIAGSLLMAFCFVLLGGVFFRGIGGLPALLVFLALMLVHTTSLGPIPWLMIPEVAPAAYRAQAMSLCATALWFACFSGALVFPRGMAASERAVGSPALACLVLAGVCVLSFLFGLFALPETCGITLEEIGRTPRAAVLTPVADEG